MGNWGASAVPKISGVITKKTLPTHVTGALKATRVVDIHTHLFPPNFGNLNLAGIDQLLDYHYLQAEYLRVSHDKEEEFLKLPVKQQADRIWQKLFVERTPLSEACRGVLTCLSAYGLPLREPNLEKYRQFFSGLSPEAHVDKVFELAGVEAVVMTNNPFDAEEAAIWNSGATPPPRFKAALRIDTMFSNWPAAIKVITDAGFSPDNLDSTSDDFSGLERFLESWIDLIHPVYLAASLPPGFAYPLSGTGWLLNKAVLPLALKRNLPLALMVGVKRGVNPKTGSAGDSLGRADISAVEALCRTNPENRFFITMLARENQHELAVTARKFRNLMPFGCWWFLNNPSLIKEMTRMRLELLGTSVIPQHSDARILDQLIYKWAHSRKVIGSVLIKMYEQLLETGYSLTPEDIQRDVQTLLAGNFQEFCQR